MCIKETTMNTDIYLIPVMKGRQTLKRKSFWERCCKDVIFQNIWLIGLKKKNPNTYVYRKPFKITKFALICA